MEKIKVTKKELDHLTGEFSEWLTDQMCNTDANPSCFWRDVLRGTQKALWFKYLELGCHKEDVELWETRYESDGNTLLLPDWLEVEDGEEQKKTG